MKVGYWLLNPYEGEQLRGWPNPPARYDSADGLQTSEHALEQARRADELGFDWVSVSEHHYWALMPTPNPAVMLAALTQVVRNAKLAWLGPLVSMNNPVRVAEEIAMLDQLSGGRIMVVFLRGTPNEFMAYDTNPDETRARTEEATELILRALEEPQPFSWTGRHFRFQTVSVWPGLTQDPRPPFFFSGNSPDSATFAARHGLGVGTSFYPPDRCADLVALYREGCSRAGWTPTSDNILYRSLACVAATDREAQERKARFYGAYGGFFGALQDRAAALARTFDPGAGGLQAFLDGMLRFCGSPETVAEQVAEVHDTLGMGLLDLSFSGGGLSHAETMDSMELFASEVIPRVRNLSA